MHQRAIISGVKMLLLTSKIGKAYEGRNLLFTWSTKFLLFFQTWSTAKTNACFLRFYALNAVQIARA